MNEHEKYDCVPDLPRTIRQKTEGRAYRRDSIGMSGAQVIMFDDCVLKTEPTGEESDNEYRMMSWLAGKLPVPEVLAFARENGRNYLLMSRVEGRMLCEEAYMDRPEKLIRLLARGLKLLWSVDVRGCPAHIGLEERLALAERNVREGLVDMDNVEKDTFGENGFKSPAELLRWLKENRPAEDLVLTHGDYCLPNIFGSEGKISGFIDLGKCGVADRYQDIALCFRSLSHNCEGACGGRAYTDVKPEMLFEELGIEPDLEKIRYYILMDELF